MQRDVGTTLVIPASELQIPLPRDAADGARRLGKVAGGGNGVDVPRQGWDIPTAALLNPRTLTWLASCDIVGTGPATHDGGRRYQADPNCLYTERTCT